MVDKKGLRTGLKQARNAHVASLPQSIRALLFRHPPHAITDVIPPRATIGLYCANKAEAPTGAYARFFAEAGHPIALPWFASRTSAMIFRAHHDPYAQTDLVAGPFGVLQPDDAALPAVPDFLFVPLLGFTADGRRLGQGGGHYDRWLADHPGTPAIGLGWDCQLISEFPDEPHDQPLTAIITPSRLYGPF